MDFRGSEGSILFWECCVVNGTGSATGGGDDLRCSVIGGGDPWRWQLHFGETGAFIDPAPFRLEEPSLFAAPEVIVTEPCNEPRTGTGFIGKDEVFKFDAPP